LRDPGSVERLVVADIAPTASRPRQSGMVRAMRGLDLAGIRRRAEADALLEEAVPDSAERAFLLQNLVFDGGAARWRINLAAIECEMPALIGFPAIPPGTIYAGPSLFIGGGRSDYLRSEDEPEIRRLFPRARIARIPEAGHWLHAEQPRAFIELVGAFLAG
jgi:pimeloyl-ACP methyl ester carboxylesterase